MNTSALAAALPTPAAEASKAQFRDNDSASNASFNDILNREIAEKSPAADKTAPAPDTPASNKTESATPSTTASNQATDEAPTTTSPEDDATDIDPSAEQILMMAAQLIPVSTHTPTATVTGDAATAVDMLSGVTSTTDAATTTPLDPNALTGVFSDAAKDKSAKKADDLGTETLDVDIKDSAQNTGRSEGKALSADLAAQDTAETAPLSTAQLPAQELKAASHEEAHPDFSTSLNALQQAANSVAQSANNAAEKIAPQVGTSAWNHAIGQKIVWMVGSEQQSASLTLNPPDLGPMQVVLSVSNTHASASFYSPHAEVREALEAAMPRLREILGDAGIQLGQANVNAGTPQQQESYTPTFTASQQSGSANDSFIATQPTVMPASRVVREGLVDTFA